MKRIARPAAWLALGCLALLLGAGQAFAATADYQGSKIYYQEMGQGQPALVLVHGWCAGHEYWQGVMPALAKKYRVIALDLPGHGKSDKPQVAYTMDYFAGAVQAVIKQAGLQRPVLAGHSMGTPVVRQVIRHNPQKVRALIIVDGALGLGTKDPKVLAQYTQERNMLMEGMKKDFAKTVRPFLMSMMGPSIAPAQRDMVMNKVLSCTPRVAVSAMQGMGDPKIWQEEPRDLPTLAIYAVSPHLPPTYEAYARRLFPNLTYVTWSGVGHFYVLERPRQFEAEVIKFMDSLPK